ncbi:MAG: single-stranded-DNA-specific exonuclease RecJ [Porticoccaceae bacterium]|nr:MAG: single-stranded-DNA-specific exonuclease RecJ [Porticoccaceae bacterium]
MHWEGALRVRLREPVCEGGDFPPDLAPVLRRVYLARGVRSREELGRRLAELPRPDSLRGLRGAVELLERALAEDRRLLIVGDFDADGATSTALVVLGLRALGARQVDFLVPNRFEYGYGLTPEIVALARQREPHLILTVDNGISSVAGVRAARDAGIQVVVTDHHLPGAELPAADAIVNPNQPGCPFPGKHLAGVGVAFFLLAALRAHLRERGWFACGGRSEPNLAALLDLVALGTVADVVPLDRCNRALVHQGLLRIRSGDGRAGVRALLEVAGRDPARAVAADLAFAAGPRLNAAGRLDDMTLGIRCLLAEDPDEAGALAQLLDQLNADRRLIEADMQREALAAVEALARGTADLPWGLCLFDPGWHQGVVGLVASRLKERFHRPVIAFARGEGGMLKGSARSIPGLHVRDALDAVASRHPGLLNRFGGHAMAAGLALAEAHFDAFSRAFDGVVRERLAAEDLEEVIWVDGELSEAELTVEVARQVRDGGPWGHHFPEPLFVGEFAVVAGRVVGERHLKLLLGCGQRQLEAIAFNAPDHLKESLPDRLAVAYRLTLDAWQGRERLQLLIERFL